VPEFNGSPAVLIRNVTKRYAGHTAVQSLSLEVPAGTIYGLLGPNGAGKTSTIRMILGIVRPDEGEITVLNHPRGGWGVNEKIGYLPEERGLYKKMKVLDHLIFLGEAKGLARSVARSEALAWLDRLGLGDWRVRKVDELSKGMQQKIQFIAAILHRPSLVVLDEPFAGLDPVNSQILKDVVRELAVGGTTILFSTHVMEQAERLCDAVCIIAKGRKILDGPIGEVKRGHGGQHLALAVSNGVSIEDLIGDRSLVARSDNYGNYAELELTRGTDPQALLALLMQRGARITRFELTEPSLHKIFVDLVGSEAAVPAAVR
jgi:ABC-2 type transport system ATP-binding protein